MPLDLWRQCRWLLLVARWYSHTPCYTFRSLTSSASIILYASEICKTTSFEYNMLRAHTARQSHNNYQSVCRKQLRLGLSPTTENFFLFFYPVYLLKEQLIITLELFCVKYQSMANPQVIGRGCTIGRWWWEKCLPCRTILYSNLFCAYGS